MIKKDKNILGRHFWIFLITLYPQFLIPNSLGSTAPAPAAEDPAPLRHFQSAFRAVARRSRPSCVHISALRRDSTPGRGDFYFMDPQDMFQDFLGKGAKPRERAGGPRHGMGMGSGVIIDADGYMLTNAHVVAQAEEIRATLIVDGSKKTRKAKIVGLDERLDIALLKIQGKGPFPAAALGNSEAAQVGDWAIAVGNPFGELEQTLTVGVISAMRQSLPIEGRLYNNLIQTDAAINRGNSGGPLLNIDGEVIGINTAIYSPSGVFAGIGFAIPINSVKEILDELRSGKQREWGWLGVAAVPLDETIARRFKLKEAEGALINEVFTDGPAEKAGLKRGDVITLFHGARIASAQELTDTVRLMSPGDKTKVTFWREGQSRSGEIIIGRRPRWADLNGKPEAIDEPASLDEAKTPASSSSAWRWEGVDVADLGHKKAQRLARRLGIPEDEKGVLVTGLDGTGPLVSYLETGDLIQEINRDATRNIKEFRKAAAGASLKDGIVLDILRRGSRQFVSVQTAP